MNRIIEVNTELAYAVIEPGVSQGELHAYLKEHKTGLWMDCTGAGADSSLVGNTLDRGFGHTRYGDHFLTTCGMEVVLADGRVLNTGYGHYPNAKAARVYRYGVGPSLDGIFCQSNYGIVTRIGLWLMPEPEDFAFFLAQVDRDEDLAALVDALRPLRINGTLNTALHIGNDLRMFSTKRRYPWEEAGGVTPMPEELRARMRRSEGMGAWNAGSSISGTREQVKSTKRIIRKALKGVAKVRFVDDRLLSLGERVTGALSRFGLLKSLKEQLRALRPVYGLLKGQPAEEALVGTQWRLRRDPGNVLDPLENGSGLMWISPVLPMTGRAAREVMDIAEPIFRSFGFDPLATFTMINERAMIGILNVYYDKSDAKETQEAMACYDALVPALMKAGYIPYRVGLRGLPKVYNGGDVFWDVAQQIKRVLDPEDIIARGRYIPPQAPSK
jgi:4-cresol dehydrogenase (hydroxylating)